MLCCVRVWGVGEVLCFIWIAPGHLHVIVFHSVLLRTRYYAARIDYFVCMNGRFEATRGPLAPGNFFVFVGWTSTH